ncbi:NifU-like protein [Mycoplasma crocodyli MP145]|uniref:NifU-like protein n=2 Tax=Mycoplasma TaxID=2093 RepID=D5E5F7_MYCCM|nr:NifU-like protein [Mycoplasma crocodyli MP145]
MNNYLNSQFSCDFSHLEHKERTYYSSSCADTLKISLFWNQNKLNQVIYEAKGCAIFKASSEIFLKNIIGKSSEEIYKYIELYYLFLDNPNNFDDLLIEKLNELWCFYNVKIHLNRLSCAKFICESIKKEFKLVNK